MPPAAQATTGPNRVGGDADEQLDARLRHRLDEEPVGSVPEARSRRRISRAARSTADGPRNAERTAPASALVDEPRAMALSATGPPSSAAAAAASAGVRTMRPGHDGSP